MSHNTQAGHVDTSWSNFKIVQERGLHLSYSQMTARSQLRSCGINAVNSKVHTRMQLRKKP